jgi:hypothetical protein
MEIGIFIRNLLSIPIIQRIKTFYDYDQRKNEHRNFSDKFIAISNIENMEPGTILF